MIAITHKNPDIRLFKYVRKISIFESSRELDYKHKLTPSAYTYLSYNHRDIPMSVFSGKRMNPQNRLQIAGPKLNEDIRVEYKGRLKQILVEFTASGFFYLFHSSPANLHNTVSGLNNFVSAAVCGQLEQELQDLENTGEQIALLEEFLLDKLAAALPFNDYIEKALHAINTHNGSLHIGDLIADLRIGGRQFDRKFREIVGISPKCYSKIQQLHYVIHIMQSKEYASIQDLAFRAEFYDLAHFTHRFKELTGFTPNEFIHSDKHIALKYFTDSIE